jgi:type IV secretory pathway VirB3-like protein
MRRERPERRASIMGIPLLPRGARGWRAGLIMLYRIFLLMVAIPVFLLFMAFSRD